jgi:transcriptional regulator
MYNPPSFAEHDVGVMQDFIEAHPLGALVTASPSGLFATHLPLVLDRGLGAFGTLQGHIARANPHHELAGEGAEALVLFTGADSYVTPSMYASKAKHGKVVPTWNYVAVHAHGVLRFVREQEALRRHLARLTATHEASRAQPWAMTDAPAEYIEKQLGAIVGVEIEIARLEGKWKMSQNRPAEDVQGVIEGLGASGDPREREVGQIVEGRAGGRVRG